MTDRTKPKYCNQCYDEPPIMFAVLVQVGSKAPELRAAGDVFVIKGRKITETLRQGFTFRQWISWGENCREEYLRTRRLKNLQTEMVI